VTAVIGPVSVEHAKLSDGGLAVFAEEILLSVKEVRGGHGEAKFTAVLFEVGLRFGAEAGQNRDVWRGGAFLTLGQCRDINFMRVNGGLIK